MVGRPYQISGGGRESLPDDREALLDVREWLENPRGCPGVVGRLSRMYGSEREALPDVRE